MKRVELALLAVVAAVCVGCGEEAADDVEKQEPPVEPAQFEPCRGELECASVVVPVDYDDPAELIELRIVRSAATEEPRLGVLLMDPGGPGSSGLDFLQSNAALLRLAVPSTAQLDLVSFDRRGVRESGGLVCSNHAAYEALRALDPRPDDAAPARWNEVAEALRADCVQSADGPLMANMSARDTARDMDRIRRALDEETLNALLLSDGTRAGAHYMSLFPERVRAFVFDSPVALTSDRTVTVAHRASGLEISLERFFAWCASEPTCALHAATVEEVRARHDAVFVQLAQAPLPVGERTLSQVDAHLVLIQSFARLGSLDWATLAELVLAVEQGDGQPMLERADEIWGRSPDGKYAADEIAKSAITCLDDAYPGGFDMIAYRELLSEVEQTAPRAARVGMFFDLPCVGWPWASSDARAPVDGSAAPPALVAAVRYDPMTPWSPSFVDGLGNGSHVVTYEGDGHIALAKSACVRSAINAFLLDPGTSPPSSCD